MRNNIAVCLFLAFFLMLCRYGVAQPSNNQHASRQLLLRDEGLSKLDYIDLAHPEKNYFIAIPVGRDMQLVGQGRVMLGTGKGYEERIIKTGDKVAELTTYDGTITARRLRNGHTVLAGLNWQGKKGIVLIELDQNQAVQRTINYPDFNYVRLIRETIDGTFLITSNDRVFEGKADGSIVWQATLTKQDKAQHAWQAQRLDNGQTLVSGGYSANFQRFDKKGGFVDSVSGPPAVNPHFFAGFQVLTNGNWVVANWQGHGHGHGTSGTQILEYTPAGKLVWSWKQDPEKQSSIQGVLVLDGLDINRLHVEDARGRLVPQ
jgi:outer membrane protein assembly factor BamB